MSQTDASHALRPADLAALVAARLCHDFLSPASAIQAGLDLLDDPQAQAMREEALGLVAQSTAKLLAQLAFCRVAYGAAGGAHAFPADELRRLAEQVFAHSRADLDWSVEPQTLSRPAAKLALHFADLAAQALPLGGRVRLRATVEAGVTALAVEATGPKARLRAEVADGLDGRPLGEGLSGPWAQAAYVAEVCAGAGGRVVARAEGDKVTFAAAVPA